MPANNEDANLAATVDPGQSLSQNPLWIDVTPLPQQEGAFPVVPIAYSADFDETMSFFRAVLEREEMSARALALTERVIEFNPANYTAWHFRRQVLHALGADLVAELAFCELLCAASPKNYQIWYHRRVLVERLGTARDEKRFTRQVLEEDAKNYHAWAHRQWFVRRFGEFEDELEFCGELLAKDVRNNSAWNHRWFVVTSRSGAAAAVTRDEWEAEARFAMELAELALHNECPYNYLRGIARSAGGGKASPSSLADFPFVGSWAFKLAARAPASCAALTAFLVDALEAARRLEDARALCVQLAEHKDVVRSSYWLRRASRLR